MARKGKDGAGGSSSEQSWQSDWQRFMGAVSTVQQPSPPNTNYFGAENHAAYYANNGYAQPVNYYYPTANAANTYSQPAAYYPTTNAATGYTNSANYDYHTNTYAQNAYQQTDAQQSNMAYNNSYGNSAYGAGYGYPPGYNTQQYAQPQQQYQAPQIRNPFAPPPPPTSTYADPNGAYDPEYAQQIAQWQSAYAPADQQGGKKGGKYDNANLAPVGQRGHGAAGTDNGDAKGKGAAADDNVTVVRKGGGETWEDKSLLEWDPAKFRIIVGNLAGEVTDELLSKAFEKYKVGKCRVVRDKRTTKSKGFGFVEFNDSELGFKAAREMAGKYIGSHPVTIERSKTNVAPTVKNDKKKNNKYKGKNDKKKDKKKDENDPLRANTQAGIEKKAPNKAPLGLKLLG